MNFRVFYSLPVMNSNKGIRVIHRVIKNFYSGNKGKYDNYKSGNKKTIRNPS